MSVCVAVTLCCMRIFAYVGHNTLGVFTGNVCIPPSDVGYQVSVERHSRLANIGNALNGKCGRKINLQICA